MRYYLAIDAYLGAYNAPPRATTAKASAKLVQRHEQYPRQLHEMERAAYIDMKQSEYLRQKTLQ